MQAYVLDRAKIAVIGPGQTDDDTLIRRCLFAVCGEASIHTHRIGSAVEVSITGRLYDHWGTPYYAMDGEKTVATFTIASGETVRRTFTVFDGGLIDTDSVTIDLLLSNRMVQRFG